jgi:hypothetical protein
MVFWVMVMLAGYLVIVLGDAGRLLDRVGLSLGVAG